jgi:DNA invertase Pin-like site-specific DNA recombinase
VLAEVERAWIAERTHAGPHRTRAQGERLGRPRVITDAGKLRQLLANGVSHRAAARALKVSEGTVRRAVLQNVALLRSP